MKQIGSTEPQTKSLVANLSYHCALTILQQSNCIFSAQKRVVIQIQTSTTATTLQLQTIFTD